MATNSTGKSDDPLIVEECGLKGDSIKNPIIIQDKTDAYDFMDKWTDEEIREYLLKQKKTIEKTTISHTSIYWLFDF